MPRPRPLTASQEPQLSLAFPPLSLSLQVALRLPIMAVGPQVLQTSDRQAQALMLLLAMAPKPRQQVDIILLQALQEARRHLAALQTVSSTPKVRSIQSS